MLVCFFFFFKQKTAYEMRISDWSSDVCSSDLLQNLSVDGAPSFVETDPATLKPLYGGLTRSEYVPSFSNVKYRLYNGTIDYDVGFATLTRSAERRVGKEGVSTCRVGVSPYN